MLQGLIFALFALAAGLIAFIVGTIGHFILKLMKEELNLKIKINSEKKEP